jgi:hypothetical protein
MSHNTELKAEWADREIAKLKQLIAKEENEMRDDARLSQVSNSVSKKKRALIIHYCGSILIIY